jgi:hypothetical protein
MERFYEAIAAYLYTLLLALAYCLRRQLRTYQFSRIQIRQPSVLWINSDMREIFLKAGICVDFDITGCTDLPFLILQEAPGIRADPQLAESLMALFTFTYLDLRHTSSWPNL